MDGLVCRNLYGCLRTSSKLNFCEQHESHFSLNKNTRRPRSSYQSNNTNNQAAFFVVAAQKLETVKFMMSLPLVCRRRIDVLFFSLVYAVTTHSTVLVRGQEEDVPRLQWEYDTKCALIASDLNNPTDKLSRPESFFQLLKKPFQCQCVNATTLGFDEFGQGLGGCRTDEILCAADSSGDDHAFLGVITVLDVFNFTDRTYEGTISNTPVGHISQQCMTYLELYNQTTICLNFSERTDQCGVQINGDRCTTCEREGPQSYKVDCSNINPDYSLDTITETATSDAALNGTILRFLDTLASSRECTGYPQGCAYVESLVNLFPSVVDTFQNPFVCQCLDNFASQTINMGVCENGQLACLRDTNNNNGNEIDPFLGSLSYEITFDSDTEEFFSINECFRYASLYDAGRVCIRQDQGGSGNNTTCNVTVNGEECSSCVLCNSNATQPLYQGDCSNLIPGAVFDQCTNGGTDTILRFHTKMEPANVTDCPPLSIRGPPYQGVFQMSNQASNEIAVFKVTDQGYLEPLEKVYPTGGLGYPYVNSPDSLNDLGSANALMYHVWHNKQWLIAVNPGGPNARPSVTVFEIQPDLILTPNDPVILRGVFACSVAAYEDRVCTLGCGGTLMLECFLLDVSGTLTLVQTHNFIRTIPNDPLRANAPSVNVNGGGNVLFSPDGAYLGVLYKSMDLGNGTIGNGTAVSNDPAGLYLFPVNPHLTGASPTPPYGDFIFVEQDRARGSFTFAWGADSGTAYIVNALGDPMNNASSISVISNATDTGNFTEIGNFGIQAKRASWIEYLNGTLYTGNWDNGGQTKSSVTVVALGSDGTPSDRGVEIFQSNGVGAADLVVGGAKLTGEQYIHVELHGGNKIGTYKVDSSDGSLELAGYTSFPGEGVKWVGAAGIAATTLSGAELTQLYNTVSPTDQTTALSVTPRMPVAATPSAAPVDAPTSGSVSLLSSSLSAIVTGLGCFWGSAALLS
jgi:hypothetical protein